MVRIVKLGRNPMTVAKSAYDNFYKNSGWSIDSVQAAEAPETIVEEDGFEGLDEEWEETEEYEKPISEMTVEELHRKADDLGIDVSGLTSAKQLRDKIRKSLA